MSALQELRSELTENSAYDIIPSEKRIISELLDKMENEMIFVGAAVSLVGSSGPVHSADTIPFDTVVFDTDELWDEVNHQFSIPAGKDGIYEYGIRMSYTDVQLNLDELAIRIFASGDAPTVYIPAVSLPNLDVAWDGVGSIVGIAREGDIFLFEIRFHGLVTINLEGPGYNAWIKRLGDIPT